MASIDCDRMAFASNLQCDWLAGKVSDGTTIAAIEFNEGVVIGADSRTTTGAYIPNRVTDKLTKVTDRIYCCRSGSSADTQAIADFIKYHLNFLSLETGEDPKVSVAAKVFKDAIYFNRETYQAGIIVAGWDSHRGGQVYSVPLGGMAIRQPFAIGGSGSGYIYGFVDAEFKPNMTKTECLKFMASAISLAMNRDGSSGGVVRMAAITEKGVEKVTITGRELPFSKIIT